MNRIGIDELKKMAQSEYECTQKLKFANEEIFGKKEKEIIEVDIFDGIAYGQYNERDIFFTYPKKSFVKVCKSMADEIREYCKLKENQEITSTDILKTYATIICND